MNICFVCNEYPPTLHGGIGIFVKTMAHHLTRVGHTVRVIGYDRHTPLDVWQHEDGIEILRLHNPFHRYARSRLNQYTGKAPMLLERMYLSHRVHRLVTRANAHLVESFDWSGPLWYAPAHPLVVRIHGTNIAYGYARGTATAHSFYQDKKVGRMFAGFEKRNLLMADHLVAVSNYAKQATLEGFKLNNRSARVIFNGVDTKHFRPLEMRRQAGALLYVGTIHRRKGVADLLKAWTLILPKVPNAKLYLIGNYDPGELQRLLSLLTPSARASLQVIGYVPHEELPAWYNRCEVAVFPSHAESFGLTCAEAMACGCAVIMTARASGPELIEDGESGLLVEPTDNVALAGAICNLLGDSQKRQLLGENARTRAEERFALEKVVPANIEFYQSLL